MLFNELTDQTINNSSNNNDNEEEDDEDRLEQRDEQDIQLFIFGAASSANGISDVIIYRYCTLFFFIYFLLLKNFLWVQFSKRSKNFMEYVTAVHQVTFGMFRKNFSSNDEDVEKYILQKVETYLNQKDLCMFWHM